jgi:hypothetical protein
MWGGDFGTATCGGEWWRRVCAGGGFWGEGGVVWGGFGTTTCGREWYWRACEGGRFWGEGEIVWEEWFGRGFWDGGVNPVVGVPSSSLFYGKTINEW